jgi:hypothetical protein
LRADLFDSANDEVELELELELELKFDVCPSGGLRMKNRLSFIFCLSHDESGDSCCKAAAAVPSGRSEITNALSSSKTVPEESVSLP